ncbi:hypothetical protein PS861_05726 [Pseudomonas fluorescens]|nr:hypothetical protein PS861_05726 [Pseudomonas fluorescens]
MGRNIRGVQTFIRFVQGFGVVSGDINAECTDPIASKLAPTGISVERKYRAQPITLWERACSRWRQTRQHQT